MGFTHRAGAGDAADANSYAKTIPTLTGGGVLWVTVHNNTGGPAANTPTLTMTGATFTQARTTTIGTANRLTVFYSQDYDAGTSVGLTIAFAGQTQVGMLWSVEEQSPGRTVGDPLIQAVTGTASAQPSTATLSAGTGGEMFVVGRCDLNASGSPATGTELFDQNISSPTIGMVAYWDPTVRTTPTFTWAPGFVQGILMAFEVSIAGVITQAEIARVRAAVPDIGEVAPPLGFTHRAGGNDTASKTAFTELIPEVAGDGVLWVTVANPVDTAPTFTLEDATFTTVRSESLGGAGRLTVAYTKDYERGSNLLLGVGFGSSQTGIMWSVDEQSPGERTSNPVVQSAFTATPGSSAVTGTTLAAGSGDMLAVAWNSSGGVVGGTPGSGTDLFYQGRTLPTAAIQLYTDRTPRTDPHVTWSSPLTGSAMIAVEAVAPPVSWAEIAWAGAEVPSPLPGSTQVAYAQVEVPDAPVPPDPWDPAEGTPADPAAGIPAGVPCETMEYRNPMGEVVRFRTLKGTVGRFMPPIGVTTIPTPAGHGSHYLGAAHLERPVAVPVAIPGPLDGRADLRSWARILDPSVGEGTLTVVEGTWAGRRLRCVYEAGLDEWAEMNRRVNAGTLLFRAAWPYWEDSNEFTVDTDQDDTLHTWFPFLPLVFGASDAFSLFVVDNTGDVDAWPVITVHGPGEDVSVTNLTTGASWTVTGPLLPGSVLQVDHRPGHKTVRLDGVNAFSQLTEGSSLWPLVRGVNQVEVGTIDTDVDTLITFTWRRNWLAA